MGRTLQLSFVVLALALSFNPHPALAAPGVTVEDASAEEGLGTQTLHRIRLKVTSPDAVAGGFTIPWTTHDGTATAGADYRAASGTLAFAGLAGETQPITLYLLGDEVTEGDETFTVELGAPSNPAVVVEKAVGTVTVQDGTIPAPSVFEITDMLWTVGGVDYVPTTLTSWFAEHPEAAQDIILFWDIPTNFGGTPGTNDPTASNHPPFPFFFPAPGGDASSAFSVQEAVWQTRTRLKFKLLLQDTNQTIPNVGLSLREGVGRRDNPDFISAVQLFSNKLSIDTRKPEVVSVTPSLTLLREGDAGSGALSLTLAFSKAMHPDFPPTITLTGADLSPTLTPAGGSWVDDHTYVARFDVADAHQYASAIGVTVAGARDNYPVVGSIPLGNLLIESTTPNVLALKMTDPPTVNVSIAPTSAYTNVPVTATFTLINPNPVALTGATMALTLPANVIVASPNGLSTSCGGASAVPGTAAVSLTGGTIPASGTCTISVRLTSPVSGAYTLDVPSGSLVTANSDPLGIAAEAAVIFNDPIPAVPTLSGGALWLFAGVLALLAVRSLLRA